MLLKLPGVQETFMITIRMMYIEVQCGVVMLISFNEVSA